MLGDIYKTFYDLINSWREKNRYTLSLSSFDLSVEDCEQEIISGNIKNARFCLYRAIRHQEVLLALKGTHPRKLEKIKSKVESLESRINELNNKKI